MTKNVRFIFERGTKKYTCPGCNQPGKWRLYLDTKTGERLPEQYGKCERANNCGHFLDPYKDGYASNVFEQERGGEAQPIVYNQLPAPKELKPCFIPESVLNKSLEHPGTDALLLNLSAGNGIKRPFAPEVIQQIIERYKIGVSNAWVKGATCFPFIDISGNIQGVQVKKFDRTNHTEKFIGKDQQKHPKQNTLHKIIAKEHDKAQIIYPEWLTEYIGYQDQGGKIFNCFFGEHLLNEDTISPVAIVEAPKTAIVASVYFPQFVWLAVGALSYLTPERCKVLKGRNVVLFPDLNCFDKWNAKAELLKNIATFKVFPFLEENATEEERQKDLDLCDYLLQYDYLEFTGQHITEQPAEITSTPQQQAAEPFEERMSRAVSALNITCEPFDIDQIESDLKNIDIPDHPIRLGVECVIENCSLFVSSHLETIKKNNGNKTFKPHYDRLKLFIETVRNAQLTSI
jgi:hypothetical protein